MSPTIRTRADGATTTIRASKAARAATLAVTSCAPSPAWEVVGPAILRDSQFRREAVASRLAGAAVVEAMLLPDAPLDGSAAQRGLDTEARSERSL